MLAVPGNTNEISYKKWFIDLDDFIINELIPFVKKRSGVRKFNAVTIAGSSLGGLSAFDIAWDHADKINKVGVFSGSFWMRDKDASDPTYSDDKNRIIINKIRLSRKRPKLKYWFYAGGSEETADRDNDGVLDDDDKCPDTPGLASLQGCPDRDGDGIADGDDKCPDQAGLAKYDGCPVPDTDGDGVNDEEDKCPNEKGLARYQGCPIPDTDGDGVNDEEDKCPSRPGPASNQGCPEISKEVVERINIAAKNVFFATGKYNLLAKSNASLNEVAKLMKDDPSLILDISGHTDDVGSEESNQTLSENRANAVKEYLVKQGIAENRLNATGYGEAKPVADNKTAAGRAKNRRTEMTARNY